MTRISRALVSAYDKRGIEGFAAALHARGAEILSTSGTKRAIESAGVPVTGVSGYTGFPEILDGRVKTLHPKIHAGILARRGDPAHVAALESHGIGFIDVVCLNLYPFEATIARAGVTDDEAIEQIDIGGPAMLRAAAKNHADVLPVVDPADYDEILRRLDEGALDAAYRRSLAAKAFALTSRYDAAVANWLASRDENPLPAVLCVSAPRKSALRYGENPHQAAALYGGGGGVAGAEVLGGKELSYNNLQDAAAAHAAVSDLDGPAAVVVKHANPCGAALGRDLLEAFAGAWEGDPVSAFGGILAFNAPVDEALAEEIAAPGRFVEVIVAPSYSPEALRILKEKPKWGRNVRILACPPARPGLSVKSLPGGGWLAQEGDGERTQTADLKVVTRRAPNEAEMSDLVFAQRVCKHVKSNAIVLAKDGKVVGVGAGQMSRVDAARLAAGKAGERARGAVFASDAFLPFNDALEAAVDAGVTAAVQPGGSRNDEACIGFADERGIAMAFTGKRHFLH